MGQRELRPTPDTTQRQIVPAARLELHFDKFQAFVDEYRPKISLGGMYLEADQIHPVGTTIACEFKLTDGFHLCKALGEVAWIRPAEAGMGIRFKALDDQGRKLILKILEEHVKGGGEPFEVERMPVDAVTTQAPTPQEEPASTHARPASAPPAEVSPATAVPSPPPEAPTPIAPEETPASTHARPLINAAATGAAADMAAILIEPIASPTTPAIEPLDAVKPLDTREFEAVDLSSGPDEAFGAPWGQELPDLPNDVITPIGEEDVLAEAAVDFGSDPQEAGFSSSADADLLEIEPVGGEIDFHAHGDSPEAPDEISFTDDAEVLPALDPPLAEPDFGFGLPTDPSEPQASAPDFDSSPQAPALDLESRDDGLPAVDQDFTTEPLSDHEGFGDLLSTPMLKDANPSPTEAVQPALSDVDLPRSDTAPQNGASGLEIPSSPLPDAPLFDSPLPDAPLFDSPLPDSPLPDSPLPDSPLPETPQPDAPFFDATLPDNLSPDGPLTNVALPDTPQPDTPQPDTPQPDTPLPDAPLPDAPLPDTPLPDTPLPDAPLPDAPLQDAPLQDTPLPDTFLGSPPATQTAELSDFDEYPTAGGVAANLDNEYQPQSAPDAGTDLATALGIDSLPGASSQPEPLDPNDLLPPQEAWTDDDDDEWEKEEAGAGGGSGASLTRWILLLALVLITAGAYLFHEQALDLLGLGSSAPPRSAPPSPSTNVDTASEIENPALESGLPSGSETADDTTLDNPATQIADEPVAAPPATASTPPPPVSPPPPENISESAARGQARGVSRITHEATGEDTKVIVWFDGRLSADRWKHNPLSYDAQKEQIVLLGIEIPYKNQRIDVQTLELERIRTGLDGTQLKLVFDLGSKLMTLREIQTFGDRLEVHVGRR